MTDQEKSPRFCVKAFTSLALAAAFLVLGVSGIVLFLSPHGRVAQMTNWTWLGIGKHQWMQLHMTAALAFLVATAFHLAWNWTMFWGYIKKKGRASLNLKWELAVSLLLGVILVWGTLADVPPFSSFMQLKRTLGESWSTGVENGSPGQGHGAGQGQGQGRQYRGGR